MNSWKIRVVRGPTLRDSIKTVVGVIPVETLVEHYSVPFRNVTKDTGYQRQPTESRVSQLARELKSSNVDLPTSVLLNLRDAEEDEVLQKLRDDNYIFTLDPDKSDSSHRLYVVDGQHRIRALEKAINDYEIDMGKMKIPFVCMLGANEMQEMEQFHVVNSNAKSVRTDLALSLLKARAQHDPDFAKLIETRGRKWEVDAQILTERMATSSSTWKGRIRLPNSPLGDTTVPSASFVRSLKPLLTQTAIFRSLKDVDRQVQVIEAYWQAIRRVLPDAFENPTKYNIQKGVGVDVMHFVFPVVLDLVRFEGSPVFQPESYVQIIHDPLRNLEGLNGEGKTVQGVDFWKTGRAGAAGAFTSASGKRRLSEYLQSELPELTF